MLLDQTMIETNGSTLLSRLVSSTMNELDQWPDNAALLVNESSYCEAAIPGTDQKLCFELYGTTVRVRVTPRMLDRGYFYCPYVALKIIPKMIEPTDDGSVDLSDPDSLQQLIGILRPLVYCAQKTRSIRGHI